MSIPRLTALVAILVIGTAVAVGAYLDAQQGTPPVREVGSPILEFGPDYPMPRPLRATDSRVPTARRPVRATAVEAGLVRASRPEPPPGGAEVAPTASSTAVSIGLGPSEVAPPSGPAGTPPTMAPSPATSPAL